MLPILEINATEKTVFGHDGCNSFRGGIKFKPETIVFMPLASTLMACINNQEIGHKIGQVLKGEVQYKFEDKHLALYKQNKKVMVLQKVD
ncbi:MAG: META domain-containing protein [Flavobacteriaceae bacterium]|nr:META domain-containing protein [Flavobacteriaceae bacterium]